MEASTLQAPATLATSRVTISSPLLRFRSDEQLVALFRAGHDEAFRVIHDRYNKRLLAYARQMLPGRQDAEDALQDVFVRAYSGLRSSDRALALRAWLFRVAHNRCVDELRRPGPPPPEVLALLRAPNCDPIAEVETRESVRRLIEDIRRLPDQQRSALLMRELGGMSYADLSCTLKISIPAVKSLLVRARLALARAAEARDTACSTIREELIIAHDRGVRPNAMARRHIRDCSGCRCFRRELRGVSHQLAAFAPVGPLGILAQLLGFSGSGATVGGAGAGGGLAAAGGGSTAASAGGLVLGANHVATLLVAAVATAGGAVEIQHTITAASHPRGHVHSVSSRGRGSSSAANSPARSSVAASSEVIVATPAATNLATATPPTKAPSLAVAAPGAGALKRRPHGSAGRKTGGGANVGPAAPGNSGSTAGSDTAVTPGSTTCAVVTPTNSSSSTSSSTSSTTPGTSTCSGATPSGSTITASSGSPQSSSGSSTGTTSTQSPSQGSGSTGSSGGSGTSASTGGTATASASTTGPAAPESTS